MKVEYEQIDGYAYGAIQPSLLMRFSDIPRASGILTMQLAKLQNGLPSFEDGKRFSVDGLALDEAAAPLLFATIIDNLNHHCGDQRFTSIKAFKEMDALCFALPTLSAAMSVFNINAFSTLLARLSQGEASEDTLAFAEKQRQQARRFLPGGTNAGNFIAAAAERRIPFKIFSRKYIIFGYGSGSSIFNSSITDKESAIGVALAKNKVDTNHLLKMSGFPVAEQMRVRSIEAAAGFAEKVGYPVVLKPEAEEQGRGVFANIIDKTELKECFQKAARSYKQLVLEKFIPGFSYRVHVHHGQVLDAWKMNPPSVTGDGQSSIQDLINRANTTPERNSINASLKPVPVDTATLLHLQKSGLTPGCIPRKGEKITLAATSNESRGGSPQNFLPFLHPDNAALCVEAAQVLGLNISGVDLISEDAATSWRQNNTVVCEVNAQPQLGDLKSYPHLYEDVMNRLPASSTKVTLEVSKRFEQHYANLFNKAASTVVVQCTPGYLRRHGSPTQYFDEISFAEDVSAEERLLLNRMIVSVPPLKR